MSRGDGKLLEATKLFPLRGVGHRRFILIYPDIAELVDHVVGIAYVEEDWLARNPRREWTKGTVRDLVTLTQVCITVDSDQNEPLETSTLIPKRPPLTEAVSSPVSDGGMPIVYLTGTDGLEDALEGFHAPSKAVLLLTTGKE